MLGYILPPNTSGFKITSSLEIRFISNYLNILLSKILLNLVPPGDNHSFYAYSYSNAIKQN
jgi:hypothetical protein